MSLASVMRLPLPAGIRRQLFEPVFGVDQVQVSAHGNILTSSFFHRLAVAGLHEAELEYEDSDYEIVIYVRAARPPAAE